MSSPSNVFYLDDVRLDPRAGKLNHYLGSQIDGHLLRRSQHGANRL